MKTKNAKLWLLLSAILTFSTCNAYDFCSDGIYYEILSETDRTVAVTYRYENGNSYSGEITIPKKLIIMVFEVNFGILRTIYYLALYPFFYFYRVIC